MSSARPLNLIHLQRLTDDVGVIEHARLDRPDRNQGYCTDDAGRLLAVLSPRCNEPVAKHLCGVALEFLRSARQGNDGFRLRKRPDGVWTDDPLSDDATGRALEGLGVAAARCPDRALRERSLELFDDAIGWRSPYRRATSHAVLGAASVLEFEPSHRRTRQFLDDAHELLATRDLSPSWPWPDARLTYANALVPEALLALAHLRGDDEALTRALTMLEWLVHQEMIDDHFSFAPVGGRGPGGAKPGFDQQPIEAWAMSEACAHAFNLTLDRRWAHRVVLAAAWFEGRNDAGAMVCDPQTGAGYDGLSSAGVNRNQGAESTIAYLATTIRRDEVVERLEDETIGLEAATPSLS